MGACQTKPAIVADQEPVRVETRSGEVLLGREQNAEQHIAQQSGKSQREEMVTIFNAIKVGAPKAVVISNPVLDVDSNSAMFNTVKYGFNRRFASDANWFLTCRCVQDVVNAVQLCVTYKMRPTVGSGYHCYEDFVVKNPTGMLIDVSMMDNISTTKQISTSAELLIVEPGTYNWKLALHLFKLFGKLLPGGSCYSVCAGGHICGGGYGINSRLHGLTVDYIYGVEVVVADENGTVQAKTVTKDSKDPNELDLLWACTGGGGQQLGIITKYYFKLEELPPAPTEDVYLTNITVSWTNQNGIITPDQFKAILNAYGQFWDGPGRDESTWDLFTLMHTQHCSFGSFNIVVQANKWESMCAFLDHMLPYLKKAEVGFSANPDASFGLHHAHLAGNMTAEKGNPDLEYKHFFHILKFPWLTATQWCNGNPPNSRFKNTGAYHTKPFTERMLDIMYKYLTMDMKKTDLFTPSGKNSKKQDFSKISAQIQIDSYGGKINKVQPGATAVPQRDSIMKLQFQIYWDHPENDDINLWWITNLEQEMYQYCPPVGWKPEFNANDEYNPNLVTDYAGVPFKNPAQGTGGGYINYPDLCIGTLQKCYAPLYWPDYGTYHRLQLTKKEWDPKNLFNFKQSISRADHGDALGPLLDSGLFKPSTRVAPK